ncbi:MAG: hypothetical protein EAZ20_12610 [Bacteroidetes bacterium]|nr:MAG: hypothetical protein EAZ20_12610 [Bacteroidota bacterium]
MKLLIIFVILFLNTEIIMAQLLIDEQQLYQQKYQEVLQSIQTNEKNTLQKVQLFLKNYASPMSAKEILVIAGENSFFRNEDKNSIFYWNELYRYNKIISNHAKYRLGQIYIRQKEYEKGLISLESIVNRTDSTDFYTGLAAYQLWKKTNEELYAQKTILFWKNNISAPQQALLDIYHLTKNYQAIEELLPQLSTQKINNDVVKIILENAFSQKKYNTLIEYFNTYIKDKDIKLSSYQNYMLGISFYYAKNYQKSVEYLDKLVIEQTNVAQQAAYYIGKIKSIDGNFLEANIYFWRASSLDFDTLLKKNAHHIAMKISNFFQKDEVETKVERKFLDVEKKLLFNKDFSEAVVLLENKLKDKNLSEEDILAVKFWLAESYFQQGDIPKAIVLYKEILHWRSNNEKFLLASHYGLGNAYLYAQKYELAITHFQFFLMMNTEENYQDALVRLGDSYLKINDLSNAKLFYQKSKTDKEYAEIQLKNIEKFEKENKKNIDFLNLPTTEIITTDRQLLLIQEKLSRNELNEAKKILDEVSVKIGFSSEIIKKLWLQYWEQNKQYALFDIASQYWKI